MGGMLVELAGLAVRGDVGGYLRLRWEFHAVCYEAACRPRLLGEVERLFWRAERYNRLVLSSAERFARSIGFYEAFFAACERRDPAEAERVIHESVRGAVDLIWPALPSELDALPT